MYKKNLYEILDSVKGKEIAILPHNLVDVDAAVSCILLSKLFDFLEVKNYVCIFEESISKDTDEIMKWLGYDLRDFFVNDEDDNRKLFLVDHYETNHFGSVVGVIDHHLTVAQVKSDVYIYKESCATAYIIYGFMLAAGMPIDREIIRLVAYAMAVDTCVFKSSKTVMYEKENLEKLIEVYGLNYDEIKVNSLALTDVEHMSLEEIVNNGCKKYTFNNHNVVSSYIQIKNELDTNLMNNVMYKICDDVDEQDIYLWVFIIFDMENDKTRVLYVTKGGSMYEEEWDLILSRGKNIIPRVEEYFMNK